MNPRIVADHITIWLKTYLEKSGCKGFVVGISGGIDSAITSTLCAMTGRPLLAVILPIRQSPSEFDRANEQIAWLKSKFPNTDSDVLDLSPALTQLENVFPKSVQDPLTMANTRSRLRMLSLYAFAGSQGMLVAGTGNKVEDFGIGFFTKYGDGGVDVSPIAGLLKSQVYQLGKYLQVPESILKAAPTDGLFDNGKSDEDQIGASYDELEWAMKEVMLKKSPDVYSKREREVLEIYLDRNRKNQHKMNSIPVCEIPDELLF